MVNEVRIGRRHLTNLAEDNTLTDRQKLVQGHEDIVFVFFIFAIHIKLPDALHREFLPLKLDLVCTGSKFTSEIADVIWECCREQDNLNACSGNEACIDFFVNCSPNERKMCSLLYPQCLVTKSILVKHIIRFIENEHLDFRCINNFSS